MSDITDATNSVKTVLSANWNNANTDSKTPKISPITDVKRFSGLTNNTDTVLIYEGRTISKYNGLGWGARNINTTVSIDIRSTVSRARYIKLIKEVDRILMSKRKDFDTDYNTVEDINYIDLSDKRTKIYRAVYDITLQRRSEVI